MEAETRAAGPVTQIRVLLAGGYWALMKKMEGNVQFKYDAQGEGVRKREMRLQA